MARVEVAGPNTRACECPERNGYIYHQREGCTDPVAELLGWYADACRDPAPCGICGASDHDTDHCPGQGG